MPHIYLFYWLSIPGPCKGEPGLYFAISPSTEMTPALCGPAADDQMLRSPTNPMCHVAAAKFTLVTGHPSAWNARPNMSVPHLLIWASKWSIWFLLLSQYATGPDKS